MDNITATLQVIEPRNERWLAVDQAMELSAMLPEGELKNGLLKTAATTWIMLSTMGVVVSRDVEQAPNAQ